MRADVEEFIKDKVEKGFLFVINHSGGKDSQAMMIVMQRYVPVSQQLVVHAPLGEVEWGGIEEFIESTIPDDVARNYQAKSRRGLLEMVAERGMFPSPQQRQCTSDLKRGPIEREIRRYLKDNPQFEGRIVSCLGLRAEESPGRAKQDPIRFSKGNSVAGREWYDLLPIQDMLIDEVWDTIEGAGQEPHPVYRRGRHAVDGQPGMSRLSCCFCIMSSDADLRTAAQMNPALYAKYVRLERKIGRTMMMPRAGVAKTLEEITGIKADLDAYPADDTEPSGPAASI